MSEITEEIIEANNDISAKLENEVANDAISKVVSNSQKIVDFDFVSDRVKGILSKHTVVVVEPIAEVQEAEPIVLEKSLEDKIKSAENAIKGYKIKAKYAKGEGAQKAQKAIKAYELRLKMLLKKVSKGETKEEVVELSSGGGVAKDKFQVGQSVMINAKPKTEDFEINFASYIGKELEIYEALGGDLYRTKIKFNQQTLPYLLSADELEQY